MPEGVPIFPTSYFPNIALTSLLARHRHILIETQETFPKQTLRNRTVIATANGPMTLSVPLLRPDGNHTRTADIGISYSERWNVNHLRAIESAYNASPFFLYYRDDIEHILMQQHGLLLDLNSHILEFLFKRLKMDCSITLTKQYMPSGTVTNDYRGKCDYKHPDPDIHIPEYTQVFADRQPFNGNISILDLLFNMGPDSKEFLLKLHS